MLDQFSTAALPEPVTVLGVRLRPFSLGHSLILARLKSPFVPGGQYDLNDLMLAVLICSQTWRENQEFLSGADGGVEHDIAEWGKRLLAGPDFSFHKSAHLFVNYRKAAVDESVLPLVQSAVKNGQPTDAPWELIALVTCMKLGQPLESVLDQPYALTKWFVAGYGLCEGLLEIVEKQPAKTPEEIALDLERLAQMKAR